MKPLEDWTPEDVAADRAVWRDNPALVEIIADLSARGWHYTPDQWVSPRDDDENWLNICPACGEHTDHSRQHIEDHIAEAA